MKKRNKIKKLFSLGMALSFAFGGILPYADVSAAELKPQNTANQLLHRFGLHELKANTVQKDKEKQLFSENQLIVKYKNALSSTEHRKAGTKLVKRIASLHYDIVQLTEKKKLEDVIRAYAHNPNVVSISRSAYFTKAAADVKSQVMYHLSSLEVNKALALTGKHPVKVAVVDTGIDYNHPELKNKIIANYNVANPLQKGMADVHGTHIAGIIAAEKDNGIGGYGVFPNAQIISIDVFNRSFFTSDYLVAEGILEAIRQKAQVINLSLTSTIPSPIVEEAVKKALEANITVVAAAGNSGMNINEYPAAFEGVIGVGATNVKNELADFSTYGPAVDVVAPGEGIYSSVYDIDKKSTFAKLDGTSMATPMVTATAAMLLSKNPKLTPYEINYILNKTAKDLGEKGYDLKYGYGLVNPTAALRFNPKNIPANPNIAEKDLLKKAKNINVASYSVQTGTIKKLNQTDWYQFKVQKGDYIQTKLKGSADYDYKLNILFFPDGKATPSTKVAVNDTLQGKEEGYLFEAPQDGTLVIGVKDALGNYSESGKSRYTLSIDRTRDKLDDGNNAENPFFIHSLPYHSQREHGLLFFTNELTDTEPPADEHTETEGPVKEETKPIPGDSDYFRFTVPESEDGTEQTVHVSLTGVPGIDSAINLYAIEKLEEEPSSDGETEQTPEDKEQLAENQFLIDSINTKGYGEGEELTFNAVPGMEYMIEVTNKPIIDPLMMLLSGEPEIDLTRNFSSHLPYQLTIEATTLPADEDGFPLAADIPEKELIQGDIESYLSKKEALKEKRNEVITDSAILSSENNWSENVRKAAQPYELGQTASGYFQFSGDEDWFAFTPKENGIYEFRFAANENNEVPSINIFSYNEQQKDFSYLGSNLSYDSLDPKGCYQIGLKGGQTYYIQLTEKMYRPSAKAYTLTSALLASNTADKFENNDDFEKATNIGLKAITGNFASAQDIDIYYFKPEQNGLYGFVITPLSVPAKYAKLPKELLTPIDPVVIIIEDTNGNKKLDKEEEGKGWITDRGFSNEEEHGAFKAVKTKGYFIVTLDYFGDTSLTPYQFTLAKADLQDEDKNSIVKNNIPSKPLPLKKPNKNTFYNTGYMNATTNKGDVDYYVFTANEERTYTFKLELPSDLDGVISVYDAKGKQVEKADYYISGDAEYLKLKLKKGKYFIKVEDAFGNASINPYKLIVQKE
ncbi:Serine protease, subtilisin family [Parageobacillus thermantarcticus]|uniref:Serine protease, subtilisin family n=1 Tax=Parageobacillus thermantarcticus TaxID=186116 RepID=A0A1I0TLL3_9BACL|nr:S8 family peptidase [Parageobacillus thermantarcticus]SFA52634.1 Serine protease, subtilisin family [Parageobacillus thermantarcticus]